MRVCKNVIKPIDVTYTYDFHFFKQFVVLCVTKTVRANCKSNSKFLLL